MSIYNAEWEICRDALLVQSACNLTAILRSFHEAALWLHESTQSTDAVCQHPAMKLFADKVASLTGMQEATFAKYSTSYDYCCKNGKEAL